MDKIVFREFMKKEVVQKSVIFASLYGVKITKWHGSNENDQFPYRIYFYQYGKLVGHIDATLYPTSFVSPTSEFPFELNTPIGKIKGTYNSYSEYFNYDIEEKHNNFDSINGLFKIKNDPNLNILGYNIGSYVSLEIPNSYLINVGFNNCVHQSEFSIHSQQHFHEEFHCFMGSMPNIVHNNYKNSFDKDVLADIRIEQDDSTYAIEADFNFLNTDPHHQILEIPSPESYYTPMFKKIREMDISVIKQQLEQHDPRMKELIAEVREEMTIPLSNSKQLSLYDRMASLCFMGDRYKNSFILCGAEKENLNLDSNVVLKRMREYKKINNN